MWDPYPKKDKEDKEDKVTKKEIEIDQFRYQRFLQDIRDNQNLGLAILGGLGAAALGAVVWGVITAVSNYQLGIIAVGIGFLVGFVVRNFGKGIDLQFGIVGGFMSLLGCVAGNALVICIILSQESGLGIFEVIERMELEILLDWMKQSFNAMDLIFYGIAIYFGYKHSFRRITREELEKLAK
jgi:hypothetical protein